MMNREQAQSYMESLTRWFTVKYGDAPDFSLFDHTHENLDEGEWVITAEGWYDAQGRLWTACVPSDDKAPKYLVKHEVKTYPVLCCSISVRAS